jgi:hypothetical protein
MVFLGGAVLANLVSPLFSGKTEGVKFSNHPLYNRLQTRRICGLRRKNGKSTALVLLPSLVPDNSDATTPKCNHAGRVCHIYLSSSFFHLHSPFLTPLPPYYPIASRTINSKATYHSWYPLLSVVYTPTYYGFSTLSCASISFSFPFEGV